MSHLLFIIIKKRLPSLVHHDLTNFNFNEWSSTLYTESIIYISLHFVTMNDKNCSLLSRSVLWGAARAQIEKNLYWLQSAGFVAIKDGIAQRTINRAVYVQNWDRFHSLLNEWNIEITLIFK